MKKTTPLLILLSLLIICSVFSGCENFVKVSVKCERCNVAHAEKTWEKEDGSKEDLCLDCYNKYVVAATQAATQPPTQPVTTPSKNPTNNSNKVQSTPPKKITPNQNSSEMINTDSNKCEMCGISKGTITAYYYGVSWKLCSACYNTLYDIWDGNSKCDVCKKDHAEYKDRGYTLCWDCYLYDKHIKCASCSTRGASYVYNSKNYCYNCYYEKTTVLCKTCNNRVDSWDYVSDYKMCYDCYEDYLESIEPTDSYMYCEECSTYITYAYTYDGMDLCYDCYYDLKYNPSNNTACENCGDYVSSPYTYDGKDLCYNCYWDLYYYGDCSRCGNYDYKYTYNNKTYCWDCYYDLKY